MWTLLCLRSRLPWRLRVRLYSGTHADLSAARVRSTFLDFFCTKHGHKFVPSSPVRPRGDPSLLFVNAGMNQFKPLFLGTADPRSHMTSYTRVANSQKCVRAGGKHNDLDDVGWDLNHHTFFEMLGSWSFGDYFKEEACSMAWSLLTEHYGIPVDRLYVSYFAGDPSGLPPDLETRQIWLDLGVPPGRILPFGLKENFWEMGDSGPCGPCTEIHYDHVGGRDAASLVNGDSPDLVEIWNLVFMQYHRELDQSLRPLTRFSVDTGMGLERLVSVLQETRSNYDTDLFRPLLEAIHQRSAVPQYRGRVGPADEGRVDMAYRVVADHIRTLAVCIADGIHPGMSGAELVLRRILRRAVRFCVEVLKAPRGSLASLVPTVTHTLGDVYPELTTHTDRISDIINENEDHFLSSLDRGTRLIMRTLDKMDSTETHFPVAVAWSLHRDLGFPLDLVDLMVREQGYQLDPQELDRLVAENQKVTADLRESGRSHVTLDVVCLEELQRLMVPPTDESLKYEYRREQDAYVFPQCRATVLALYDGAKLVSEVAEGQRCGVIFDRTCFYAEQGGQSHDHGFLTRDGFQDVPLPVEDVGVTAGYVVHQVTATCDLKLGDQVDMHLDQVHRRSCMRNHTATHLLNFALRSVLGPVVQQRGSHVSAERLRFDFSVKGSVSEEQLQQVESRLSDLIKADQTVYCQELPLQAAMGIAGLRTVDEVYPDPVRVVSVAVPLPDLLVDQKVEDTSVELCCGTHLVRTGDIQDLVIVSEQQMVKGVSRVVAVTGRDATQAREAGQMLAQDVDSLEARLSVTNPSNLEAALMFSKEVGVLSDAVDSTPVPQWQRRELQKRLKVLQRQSNTSVRKLEVKLASSHVQDLLKRHGSRKVLVDLVETDSESVGREEDSLVLDLSLNYILMSMQVLMKTVNQLSSAAPHSHVMLLGHHGDSRKVACACQVPKVTNHRDGMVKPRPSCSNSPSQDSSFSASDWALAVCRHLGGGAGGSKLVARGTGTTDDIMEALKWAEHFAQVKTGQ